MSEEVVAGDKVRHVNRQKYPFWYTVVEVQPNYTNMDQSRIWVTIGNMGTGLTFFFPRDIEKIYE